MIGFLVQGQKKLQEAPKQIVEFRLDQVDQPKIEQTVEHRLEQLEHALATIREHRIEAGYLADEIDMINHASDKQTARINALEDDLKDKASKSAYDRLQQHLDRLHVSCIESTVLVDEKMEKQEARISALEIERDSKKKFVDSTRLDKLEDEFLTLDEQVQRYETCSVKIDRDFDHRLDKLEEIQKKIIEQYEADRDSKYEHFNARLDVLEDYEHTDMRLDKIEDSDMDTTEEFVKQKARIAALEDIIDAANKDVYSRLDQLEEYQRTHTAKIVDALDGIKNDSNEKDSSVEQRLDLLQPMIFMVVCLVESMNNSMTKLKTRVQQLDHNESDESEAGESSAEDDGESDADDKEEDSLDITNKLVADQSALDARTISEQAVRIADLEEVIKRNLHDAGYF